MRLELPSVPNTAEAAKHFVAILDKQIDELEQQLMNLHGLRRHNCEIFGIDRRAGLSKLGTAIEAANRSQYEGEANADADRRQVGGARS